MSEREDWSDKILGPYQIVDRLGRSGVSNVYKAVQSPLERYVAIKVLSPQLSADRQMVDRLRHEAEVLAKLSHRHIVTIYDVGEADGRFYIVMEYLSGDNLKTWLAEREILTLDCALLILGQVADALDYAHRREMLHCNLKPSNIVIEVPEGGTLRAVLIDFELVKPMGRRRITASTINISGTPQYMAPESIAFGRFSSASDLYALGVLAFRMLTGQAPFTGSSVVAIWYAHVNTPPPNATALRSDLPLAVDRVLQRALAKDPADRFPSGLALVCALGEALAIGAPSGVAPHAPVALEMPVPASGDKVSVQEDQVLVTGDNGELERTKESVDLGYLAALRELLIERFSQGELRTLCFDLGIDYDDLPGQSRSDKARELLGYLDRRCAVQQLVEIGRKSRPDIAWEDVLER